MRSPRKPGYEPLTTPAPSWVGSASALAVSLVGGIGRVDGLTIADAHFDGIEGDAIFLREYDNVIIERCTFAMCYQAISLQLCTNVTIRDCAFWDIGEELPLGQSVTGKHAILANECDTVSVEDCWFVNPGNGDDRISDIVNLFKTDNGTVRRCRLKSDGASPFNAGIVLGDGSDTVNGGGDGGVVEDNVLIDCTITAIGTNNVVRRNVVLNRGLVPTMDTKTAGIAVDSGSYPDNPIGPTEVSENLVLCYNSNGSLDNEVQYADTVTVTGRASNPVAPLIDEYSRWDLTGYYGAP